MMNTHVKQTTLFFHYCIWGGGGGGAVNLSFELSKIVAGFISHFVFLPCRKQNELIFHFPVLEKSEVTFDKKNASFSKKQINPNCRMSKIFFYLNGFLQFTVKIPAR